MKISRIDYQLISNIFIIGIISKWRYVSTYDLNWIVKMSKPFYIRVKEQIK